MRVVLNQNLRRSSADSSAGLFGSISGVDIMRDKIQCNCHICKTERHLIVSLSEKPYSDEFLIVANSAIPLSTFPSALALVEHLHTQRNGVISVPSASEIMTSLIQNNSLVSRAELKNSVLVLSFIPMIHRTYREVRAWFREIEPEDIAQQILTLFLDLVSSVSAIPMNNYLPIALTRALRKNSFRWAEKEKRHTIQRETDKSQEFAEPGANDTFEAVSVLNDFLNHCHGIGILSTFERDLLIKLKVEGFFAKEIIQTHTALSEKAVHSRVERILQRLQKAANELSIKDTPASFSVSPKDLRKKKNNSLKTGSFSSENQNGTLPISKSRRQLSLDSSPKQSESKQQQVAAPQRNLSPTIATLSPASGRARVISGAAPLRRAAIQSSVLPPTLARHTKFGERLSSNPDAGSPRVIPKELDANEELLSKQIRPPLAPASVRRIFLVSRSRNVSICARGRRLTMGERSQRFDDGVHNYHRAWALTRLHCGRRTDLRFW
jgi:DNA-directed RNA polymerase specialized sigma24 family protein